MRVEFMLLFPGAVWRFGCVSANLKFILGGRVHRTQGTAVHHQVLPVSS